MSNNSHFMAVTISEFRFDPEYWIKSPGLSWCGDSFETGYVFREQIDTVLAPLMSPELLAILNEQALALSHPTLDELRQNEDGASVIGLTAALYAELREVVHAALESADWSPHDTHDWQALTAARTVGDYYVLIEFE